MASDRALKRIGHDWIDWIWFELVWLDLMWLAWVCYDLKGLYLQNNQLSGAFSPIFWVVVSVWPSCFRWCFCLREHSRVSWKLGKFEKYRRCLWKEDASSQVQEMYVNKILRILNWSLWFGCNVFLCRNQFWRQDGMIRHERWLFGCIWICNKNQS